jgi:hypothetical protein
MHRNELSLGGGEDEAEVSKSGLGAVPLWHIHTARPLDAVLAEAH